MDNERFGAVGEPTPPAGLPVVQDPTQLHIVEATPQPQFAGVPVAPFIADGSSDPTTVVPVQTVPMQAVSVHAVQPVAYEPFSPVYPEERFIRDEPRPVWPYIAAVVALILGGLAGYLIGSSGEDDSQPAAVTSPAGDAASGDVSATFDMLLARTRAEGQYMSPSEYPQLDEITAIDNAAATRDLQTQVTAAQDEAKGLTGQVAVLEVAVADLTAERDALAAQVAGNGGTNTDMQAQLDEANAQIATLTAELDTARSDLDTANAALRTAQDDLATARAAYDALNVMPVPDYFKVEIARVRTEAAANGWTLIEQPTNSTTAPVGSVLEQIPAEGTNMIEGSVLYVKVAKRP